VLLPVNQSKEQPGTLEVGWNNRSVADGQKSVSAVLLLKKDAANAGFLTTAIEEAKRSVVLSVNQSKEQLGCWNAVGKMFALVVVFW
jgi:hypothetical protein